MDSKGNESDSVKGTISTKNLELFCFVAKRVNPKLYFSITNRLGLIISLFLILKTLDSMFSKLLTTTCKLFSTCFNNKRFSLSFGKS